MYLSGSATPYTFCRSAIQKAWVSCFSSPRPCQWLANCFAAARRSVSVIAVPSRSCFLQNTINRPTFPQIFLTYLNLRQVSAKLTLAKAALGRHGGNVPPWGHPLLLPRMEFASNRSKLPGRRGIRGGAPNKWNFAVKIPYLLGQRRCPRRCVSCKNPAA